MALAISLVLGTSTSVPILANEPQEKLILEEVTVLGSRRNDARSVLDAAVPIDVIGAGELQRQGDTDAISTLIAVIPSLNANREPISDAATLVRPINLRSLASDQTLVLVNGKRRHRGAVVGEFVSGVNRGAQGVDVGPLFSMALKQVEVLRDGASAQYGSDAIAGVINFALQDDPNIRSITAQYSEAYEGDGETVELSGVFGFPIGSNDGFAVVALQAKDSEPTSRGVQDGDGTNSGASALGAAGFPVADPVVVWGSPEVNEDYKIIVNSALPIGDEAELYAFGNYATRDVEGSFFYRNPTSQTGVFAEDGNVLFTDSTGAGCPVAPLPTSSFVEAETFINSAPSNCFAFNSIFPGGFTPRFGGNVTDYSAATGFRGTFADGMFYDVSVVYGKNEVEYQISNSINASLGAASPLDFDLGAQVQDEVIVNADFSKGIDVAALESDLNIAFGFQYHDENFEIAAGQLESYVAGPFADQGFSVGSNGFQGFSPRVAGNFSRDSHSAYIDLEADITEELLVSGAIRYEDFSDFGDTTNGKLALRYKVSAGFNLRGAISSGFRAPSVGQSNLQRSATNFNNGQLEELIVVSSTNPIAQGFGGKQLEAEEANNISVGFTASVGLLDITVDYFDIDIEGRIAQVTQDLMQADRDFLAASGSPDAATVSQVSFFVNDYDTNTSGIDIVADYPLEWSDSTTNVTLAMNYTDTQVTDRGATVSDARAREVEDALPDFRATLSFDHNFDPFRGLLRINYFGEAYEALFNDETLPVETDGLFIVDAELSWQYNDIYSFAIGAKNIFDEYPDEYETAGFTGRDGGFLGAIYPLNHPAGLGGGRYYLRVSANF
ncbi:MAG: iron complex outermembrane receptor protein [Porticoccus sp.]|jgi:iron complex outermembrane receptor protein